MEKFHKLLEFLEMAKQLESLFWNVETNTNVEN